MLSQLQTFLLEEGLNLEKLDSFLNEPNYLEIFGISYKELQHSNFLAWFLDPNGSHKAGSYFLKSFINLIEMPEEIKIRINLYDLENTKILREHKNIDILIINDSIHFTICIENKIKAGKSSTNQLLEYYDKVESMWTESSNHSNFYIYLTPFPRSLSQKEIDVGYINLTYREILDIIEELLRPL